jgi:hypothetical protein
MMMQRSIELVKLKSWQSEIRLWSALLVLFNLLGMLRARASHFSHLPEWKMAEGERAGEDHRDRKIDSDMIYLSLLHLVPFLAYSL